MAGIGFELRRLKRDDTFLGTLQAYTASGIITSGPWIISILSIAILSGLLHNLTDTANRLLILSAVTHVYAFMLILTGAPSLVLTRFAADCFSEKTPEKILPSYLAALTGVLILAAVVSGAFFYFGTSVSPLFQLAGVTLSLLVAGVFITSNYLGALKRYSAILIAFLCGYGLSCVLAYELTRINPSDPAYALAGFVIGHLVLFVLLFAALYRELPHGKKIIDFGSFRYFAAFPFLALAGLFYNAGIWVDKLLFWWFSPDREQIHGAMFGAPDYDVAVYLSILSIVPGMAIFCLKLETEFAQHFTRYFKLLNGEGCLAALQETKERIAQALREGLKLLARVQGITTVLLVIFADLITGALGLGEFQLGVVRVTLIGSFFLVLFLSLLTVLFYFDDRKGAVVATFVFFAVNGGVTLVTLLSGQAYYGVGYVLAAVLGFAIAATRTNQLLEKLEYRIFTANPFPKTKHTTA